jgi:hypothetical protein
MATPPGILSGRFFAAVSSFSRRNGRLAGWNFIGGWFVGEALLNEGGPFDGALCPKLRATQPVANARVKVEKRIRFGRCNRDFPLR